MAASPAILVKLYEWDPALKKFVNYEDGNFYPHVRETPKRYYLTDKAHNCDIFVNKTDRLGRVIKSWQKVYHFPNIRELQKLEIIIQDEGPKS